MSTPTSPNTQGTPDLRHNTKNTAPTVKELELGSFQMARREGVRIYQQVPFLWEGTGQLSSKGSTGREIKSNCEKGARKQEKKMKLRMRGYNRNIWTSLFQILLSPTLTLGSVITYKRKRCLYFIAIKVLLLYFLLKSSLWISLQRMLLVHRQADFYLVQLCFCSSAISCQQKSIV